MCEFCQTVSYREERKVEESEGLLCVFSTELTEMCGAVATWEHIEQVVDDHLCEEHAQELAEQLGEGLMDDFQTGGVAEGEALKPIQAAASCDHLPDGTLGASLTRCPAPAKYAEVTLASYYFCGRHRNFADDEIEEEEGPTRPA